MSKHIKKWTKWTEQEVQLLKEMYEIAPKQELLKLFKGRSWQSIRGKAQSLGLKRNEDAIRQSQILGNKNRENLWSDEEIEIVKQYYAIGGSKLVKEKIPRRSREAIVRLANKLGLKVENREVEWRREEVDYVDDGSRRTVVVTYTRIN